MSGALAAASYWLARWRPRSNFLSWPSLNIRRAMNRSTHRSRLVRATLLTADLRTPEPARKPVVAHRRAHKYQIQSCFRGPAVALHDAAPAIWRHKSREAPTGPGALFEFMQGRFSTKESTTAVGLPIPFFPFPHPHHTHLSRRNGTTPREFSCSFSWVALPPKL